ncbi:MAG TPA: portal protein [bacterium]|nr:portal protein [bacterium]
MEIVNYADREDYVKKVRYLIDVYQDVKNERKWLEDEWDRWDNIWRLKTQKYQKYNPLISEVIVPIIRKKTEDVINEITSKLFPYGDNFMILPMPGTPEGYADAVKKLLQYQFFEEMKIPVYFKSLLREMLIKGTAVAKLYWEKDSIKFKILDLKNDFYVYPETADDIEDALITFERIIVDRDELERMAEIGKYTNVEKIKPLGSADVKERLTEEKYVKQYQELPYYEIIECYTKVRFNEDDRLMPYIISFEPSSKTIIQITPSPYFVNTDDGDFEDFKPYLAIQFHKIPNSFYGASHYSQVQYLQFMLNDLINIMLDNAILVQNPIAKVDPAKVQSIDSLIYAPGAIWQCEPDGVIFDRPPSILNEGLLTFQYLKNLTDEYSNLGLITPLPTKRQTATEIIAYTQTMSTFIQTIVNDIEVQFLTPLMKKTFLMDKLYISKIKLKKILGELAFKLNIKEEETRILEKEYSFRWIGTIQSMNIYVKNQQLMLFMQILSQIPQEILGGQINWQYIIKEIWKSLGNTDVDNIIKTPQNQQVKDPFEENELMALGKEVEVSILDDDVSHIFLHDERSKQYQEDETIFGIFTRHIQQHFNNLRQKMTLQQQLQQGGESGTRSERK